MDLQQNLPDSKSSGTVNMAYSAGDQLLPLTTPTKTLVIVEHIGMQTKEGTMTSLPHLFVNKSHGSRKSDRLGIALITIGLLSVIFHGISYSFRNEGLIAVGHGFWCGSVFVVTGLVGVWAARKKRCIINYFGALCIFSTALSVCLFGLSLAAVHDYRMSPSAKALQTALAITAIAAGIVSVRGVVICCRVIRPRKSSIAAIGVQGILSSNGIPQKTQMLHDQRQKQKEQHFLLQQLQPSQTAVQYPVVYMVPSQAAPMPSFDTHVNYKMTDPAS